MMQSQEIILVSMPYSPMIQPSLALGLLKAILDSSGRSCRVEYPNISFTSVIGEEAYRTVIKTMSSDGLRDWTFRASAFPCFKPDDHEYLRLVYNRNVKRVAFQEFRETAEMVREAAAVFTRDLAARLVSCTPMVVGCTSSMNQHIPSLALMKQIRKLDPGIVTLMGGANCQCSMGRVTHEAFPWIDYAVSGEADGLITNLMELIEDYGRGIPQDKLPIGVYAPCHRNRGYPTDDRAVFSDLDGLPLPDFSDYFRTLQAQPDWLREMILPSLPVETSRGCWWGKGGGCTFCGMDHSRRPYVSKSPERVLDEFQVLEERYGTGRIQSADNIMDVDYFDSLLPKLAELEASFRLFYEIRPTVNADHLKKLASAGIRWVWAGIESFHQNVLELANKGIQAWQNIQFLRLCRQLGIFVGYNIMCDFPEEDDSWYAEMAATIESCVHLQPPAGCSRVRFDRFSEYQRDPGRFGLELFPSRLSSYLYPLSKEQLQDQVYFFEDESRMENPLFDALLERPGIRKLKETVDEWQRRFYSNDPARLEFVDNGHACSILDTRWVPGGINRELTGTGREVFMKCTAAPTVNELLNDSGTGGIAQEALEELVEMDLVLIVGNHVIALPLVQPAASLPEIWEYPGGGLVSRRMRTRMTDPSSGQGE